MRGRTRATPAHPLTGETMSAHSSRRLAPPTAALATFLAASATGGVADARGSAEVRARGGRLLRNGRIRGGSILGSSVSAGVVTQSLLTGAFTWLLPGVGRPGTFVVPFAPIELDHDLGDFDGHDLGVGHELGGGGFNAREPASVVQLGTGAALLLLGGGRRRPDLA
jgi:hypothetical protein